MVIRALRRAPAPLARPERATRCSEVGPSAHELPHGGSRRRQFILRAEHHELRSRHRRGNMPRRHVERVARLDDLFAVVVTGEYPEGIRDFLVGVSRWTLRVQAYVGLLTDEYPPFSLSASS